MGLHATRHPFSVVVCNICPAIQGMSYICVDIVFRADFDFRHSDPTTPGYPAYENSTRTNGSNIPGIPSLPISWANAQVLLKDLEESEGKHQVKMVNHGELHHTVN